MERFEGVIFAVVACLVLVVGTVAFDRAREYRSAKEEATLAAVLEEFRAGSSGPERLTPGDLTPPHMPPIVMERVAAPYITAAFFDSVFPTPQVGG